MQTSARPGPDLVVVGGVPGAGKSTAIRALAAADPRVVALDPEQVTARLRSLLGDRVPYRRFRSLVHVIHTVRLLAHLVAGPRTGRILVVHDPATRAARRALLARWARRRGWRTGALFIDVAQVDALQGQHDRGRVMAPRSFEGHWSRWERMRDRLDADGFDGGAWDRVSVVTRNTVVTALRVWCGPTPGAVTLLPAG